MGVSRKREHEGERKQCRFDGSTWFGSSQKCISMYEFLASNTMREALCCCFPGRALCRVRVKGNVRVHALFPRPMCYTFHSGVVVLVRSLKQGDPRCTSSLVVGTPAACLPFPFFFCSRFDDFIINVSLNRCVAASQISGHSSIFFFLLQGYPPQLPLDRSHPRTPTLFSPRRQKGAVGAPTSTPTPTLA